MVVGVGFCDFFCYCCCLKSKSYVSPTPPKKYCTITLDTHTKVNFVIGLSASTVPHYHWHVTTVSPVTLLMIFDYYFVRLAMFQSFSEYDAGYLKTWVGILDQHANIFLITQHSHLVRFVL